MAAILEDGKLRLSGYVGDYYYEDGFTAADVVVALAAVTDDSDLTVHVNSPGGIATEGAAIHALLAARRGVTDVVIEGIAASAASLIAMAGATVTMSAGSTMMIHDPSGFTFGTSADHVKTVEGLEALATSYARVYADKSGKSPEACRDIMRAETWLTPAKAVEEGFADDTTEKKAEPVAAFDYRFFDHAPKRLTALAAKKDWRLPDAGKRTSASASPRQQEEISMTEKNTAEDKTADIEKAKTEAGTSAVAAYKTRRANVMAMEDAKGREDLAEELIDSDLSEDRIRAMLAKAPKAPAKDAESTGELTPEAYGNARMGLAQPGRQPTAKGNKSVLAEAVARTNKRR